MIYFTINLIAFATPQDNLLNLLLILNLDKHNMWRYFVVNKNRSAEIKMVGADSVRQ